MTNAQKAVVERIKKELEQMAKEFHNNGEVKEFTVTDHGSFVSIVGVTGCVGDDGTYAAILCRERIHIFVGKKGAVTYPIWKYKQKKQITRRRERFQSLWSIYYEQEKAEEKAMKNAKG